VPPARNRGYTGLVGHRTWQGFVDGVDRHGHAVQVYSTLDELAESAGAYLAAGFDLGDPAVIVATDAHLTSFEGALAARGWTRAALDRGGLLFFAEADATLTAIMADTDEPSATAFEDVIGGLLDQAVAAFPGREARVFGEMVDLLVQRGEVRAAAQLEDLWNGLASRRAFSLLCGYELNVFDRSTQTAALPAVCGAHTHVRTAANQSRFARAVDDALEETLGYEQAGKVYVMVQRDVEGHEGVPMAQRVLMWLSENMPASADRILATASERYFARPLTAD
jgi:hypothetical protein